MEQKEERQNESSEPKEEVLKSVLFNDETGGSGECSYQESRNLTTTCDYAHSRMKKKRHEFPFGFTFMGASLGYKHAREMQKSETVTEGTASTKGDAVTLTVRPDLAEGKPVETKFILETKTTKYLVTKVKIKGSVRLMRKKSDMVKGSVTVVGGKINAVKDSIDIVELVREQGANHDKIRIDPKEECIEIDTSFEVELIDRKLTAKTRYIRDGKEIVLPSRVENSASTEVISSSECKQRGLETGNEARESKCVEGMVNNPMQFKSEIPSQHGSRISNDRCIETTNVAPSDIEEKEDGQAEPKTETPQQPTSDKTSSEFAGIRKPTETPQQPTSDKTSSEFAGIRRPISSAEPENLPAAGSGDNNMSVTDLSKEDTSTFWTDIENKMSKEDHNEVRDYFKSRKALTVMDLSDTSNSLSELIELLDNRNIINKKKNDYVALAKAFRHIEHIPCYLAILKKFEIRKDQIDYKDPVGDWTKFESQHLSKDKFNSLKCYIAFLHEAYGNTPNRRIEDSKSFFDTVGLLFKIGKVDENDHSYLVNVCRNFGCPKLATEIEEHYRCDMNNQENDPNGRASFWSDISGRLGKDALVRLVEKFRENPLTDDDEIRECKRNLFKLLIVLHSKEIIDIVNNKYGKLVSELESIREKRIACDIKEKYGFQQI
ncbi:uncharacterized protein LOC141906421 isoform X2 [Tubulanus polymorphus]